MSSTNTGMDNAYEIDRASKNNVLPEKAFTFANGDDFTTILPHNLLLRVFTFCDHETLMNLSQVSWYCRLLVESNDLWLVKCNERGWCAPSIPAPNLTPPSFWKRFYFEKLRLFQRTRRQQACDPHNDSAVSRMLSNQQRLFSDPRVVRALAMTTNQNKAAAAAAPSNSNQLPRTGRLSKVPECYVSGKRNRASSQLDRNPRLVSLPKTSAVSSTTSTTGITPPWLPSSKGRPRSCDPHGLAMKWNAVRRRYSILGTNTDFDSEDFVRPTFTLRNSSLTPTSPMKEKPPKVDVRYAEVFTPAYIDDLESVSQFSRWKHSNQGDKNATVDSRQQHEPMRFNESRCGTGDQSELFSVQTFQIFHDHLDSDDRHPRSPLTR